MSPVNMVHPLSLYQAGAEASYAQGVLTLAVQPTAGDTMIIGDKTYTWVASGASADGEINRGADVAEAKVNAVAAINGTDGWNEPHPLVTAATFSGDNCTITSRIPGPTGDEIATTETYTSGSNVFDAATLGATTAGAHARGTPVAATKRIPVPVQFENDDVVERNAWANGVGFENQGNELVVARGTRFTIPDHPLAFEEFPFWGLWAFDGSPATVPTSNAGEQAVWTFTPAIGADPDLLSRTLERRLTDGSNNIDDEFPYAMLEEWGFKVAQRETVKVFASGFARARADSTFTSAISNPSALTQIPAARTEVFVNDTWATVGNTEITNGQVVGVEFTYKTGMGFEEAAENRSTLDFPTHEFRPKSRGFMLKLKVKVQSGGFAYTERAKAESAALRAVRVRFTVGSQVLTFDMLVKHVPGTALVDLEEKDEQDVVTLEYTQSTDLTNAISVTATVGNEAVP